MAHEDQVVCACSTEQELDPTEVPPSFSPRGFFPVKQTHTLD